MKVNKFHRFEDVVANIQSDLDKKHQSNQSNQKKIAERTAKLIENSDDRNIWF